MANEDQHPEDYPGLIASVPTNGLEMRLQILEERSNVHTKLFLDSVEDDIAFTAGEVLKWAVKKQGVAEGECLHYFDQDPEVVRMVYLACRAYGAFGPNPDTESLTRFKVMTQEIIQVQNGVAHFRGLAALERKIRKCITAINTWPHLQTKYPNQTRVILNFSQFKSMLPDCFKTDEL